MFHSAWVTDIDYEAYRERKKQAQDLKVEIAETSIKLADLINLISSKVPNSPPEFFGINDLLEKTDNVNDRAWSNRKYFLLGLIRENECADSSAESTRNTISYYWDSAPDLPAILNTVARSAEEFIPENNEFIEEANTKRQKNLKNEYLRAFISKLGNSIQDELPLTDFLCVISILANVVINDSEDFVTENSIRTILKSVK